MPPPPSPSLCLAPDIFDAEQNLRMHGHVSQCCERNSSFHSQQGVTRGQQNHNPRCCGFPTFQWMSKIQAVSVYTSRTCSVSVATMWRSRVTRIAHTMNSTCHHRHP